MDKSSFWWKSSRICGHTPVAGFSDNGIARGTDRTTVIGAVSKSNKIYI